MNTALFSDEFIRDPQPECVTVKGDNPIEYYDPDEPVPFDAESINKWLHKLGSKVTHGWPRPEQPVRLTGHPRIVPLWPGRTEQCGMNLAAVKSELAGQVRAFVDWVGAGRKLT